MGSWMPNHRDLYPWGLATSQSVALLFSRVLAAPGAWDVQDLMSMLDSRSWLSFKSWGCPFRPTQVMVLGIWHSSFCWRECHTPFCWKQPLTIRPYENLIRHRQTNQTTQPSAHLHKLQAWPIRCGYLHHKTRAVLLPCHESLTSAQVSDGFIMPWFIPWGKIVFANRDQHLMHGWNHHDVVNPIENIILNITITGR